MPDESNSLHPINILTEELRNEDVQARLKSISKLTTIALALGSERTRTELLPFVRETVYDEDEVLFALAEQLGGFIPLVGGDSYAYQLLEPLEQLACIEETVVREKAVEVINRIAAAIPQEHLEPHFLPLVRRLTQGDWFTNRVSACGLYAIAYSRSTPPLQEELQASFKHLVEDDTPMVRRAAATNLEPFCRAIINSATLEQETTVTNEIVPILHALAIVDEQDSVRCLTIPAIVTIATLCRHAKSISSALFNLMTDLISDKSWRVRQKVALQFDKLQKVFLEIYEQDSDVESELISSYVSLFKDVEGEVRAACSESLGITCSNWHASTKKTIVLETILPIAKNLVHDSYPQVKESIGRGLIDIAKILGKELAIKEILPLLTCQLRDESPEVRLNVVSNLNDIDMVIGMESLCKQVLPVIIELSEDQKWRIRLAIIRSIPLLCKELGKSVFEDKLSDILTCSLDDSVYAIREAGSAAICKLGSQFGQDWTKSYIIPKMNELANCTSYLKRITCLQIANGLIDLDCQNITEFLTIVTTMSKDTVPNVRFNCAKTLGKMNRKVKSMSPVEVNNIKTSLNILKTDQDDDVTYFAKQSCALMGY